VLGLDLVGDFLDAGGRGHVALVEEDFAGCFGCVLGSNIS
jgi:hypothetical protein